MGRKMMKERRKMKVKECLETFLKRHNMQMFLSKNTCQEMNE